MALLVAGTVGALGCHGDRPHGPPQGSLGGLCYEDGTCDEGLACNDDGHCVRADSCEGVDCSGHGTCEVQDGAAQCQCESGYHADGLSCIENEDQTPPVISDFQAKAVGSALIEVTWMTDEAATSQVDYGEGATDRTMGDDELVTDHRVVLSGLATETTYQVRARSADEWGNEAVTDATDVSTNGIDALLVRTGHPIMFIDDQVLAQVQQKTDDLASFHDRVLSHYMADTDDPLDTLTIRQAMDQVTGYDPRNVAPYYAMDGHLNQDPLAKAYGKQLVLSLIEREMTFANGDEEVRTSLFALGFLYDWLYDELDDSLRARVRSRIVDTLDFIQENRSRLLDPNFDLHNRLANVCALLGLLPLFHDIQADGADVVARYMAWLNVIVDNFRRYILPDQAWATEGGMNEMGWAYAASYSGLEPYLAWDFAVDEEPWLSDWQGDFFYGFLYGMRNDKIHWDAKHWDTFPYWGDVWNTQYYVPFQPNLVGLAASGMFYDNDVAKWFYTQALPVSSTYMAMTDLLYRDFGPDAGTSPESVSLPMSRLFPHSGYVLMRDRWDDLNANTLMAFRSGSFYAFNHNHRDMNAFTIFYKGPLAIDSGGYNVCGQWGSSHWWNYYTRTVAHNSMLVYDPNEVFKHGSTVLANDGGQKMFEISSPHLEDMLPGGANHLDGVLRYEDGGDYAYVLGDATKAYSADKLSLFQRSVAYVRNMSYDHPAMIIYDHVVATQADFAKAYLLHSIEEPTVDGDQVLIHIDTGDDPNDQGLLYQTTLLPEQHQLRVVGGSGQEFYVDDDGTGSPHNYIEDCTGTGYVPTERQKGAWRVEVQPTESSAEDFFLHVLSIADEADHSDPVEATLVQSAHLRGALLQDPDGTDSILVLFAEGNTDLADSLSLPTGQTFAHILVVGLDPNTHYSLDLDLGHDQLTLTRDDSGTLLASDQGTLYEQVQ
ncbi:MAG: heparinase II/III family protein [Deltaproteobacteria bacterium]|nr:heparinase II/III family protein [Deltaproteobacteria bacterium]